MHAQLYMKYDANWTKDGDSTSRIADLDRPIDWDSEMYARSERCGVKSELGERISPYGESRGHCVEVEQDEETGRDKVHDEEVLENNTWRFTGSQRRSSSSWSSTEWSGPTPPRLLIGPPG